MSIRSHTSSAGSRLKEGLPVKKSAAPRPEPFKLRLSASHSPRLTEAAETTHLQSQSIVMGQDFDSDSERRDRTFKKAENIMEG